MKKVIAILILAVSLFALAACGGSEAPAAPTATTLNFEAQDIAFDQTAASVKSGAKVTVKLNNTGALEHSWVLVAADFDTMDTGANYDTATIANANSGLVAGGETKAFTFTAPAAGTYQFVCSVAGHSPAGMVGTLTVED